MIERLHEAGLKSEHARIAATIGSSFVAWAASLKAEKAGTDRAERWGTFADGASAPSGLGNTLLHPLTATPGRASPWTPLFRTGSPDRWTAGRSVTERSRMGAGMTAVQRMAAVAMMAGLLTSPAAPPNRPPGRPRRRFYLWHVVMDWLGYRRARRGSAGGNE